MTLSSYEMPINGVKRDIVEAHGIAPTDTVNAVVGSRKAGAVIDDASIDLATIKSGFIDSALSECRNLLIGDSAEYTTMPPTKSFVVGVNHINPKLNPIVVVVDGSSAAFAGFLNGYHTIFLVVSRLSFKDKGTGLAYNCCENIANYIRESLP